MNHHSVRGKWALCKVLSVHREQATPNKLPQVLFWIREEWKSLDSVQKKTRGQDLGGILDVLWEFCTWWMLKIVGTKPQKISETKSWDCFQVYSSKTGMYFDPEYPVDWGRRVRLKYPDYIEGTLVSWVWKVGGLSKEVEGIINKKTP